MLQRTKESKSCSQNCKESSEEFEEFERKKEILKKERKKIKGRCELEFVKKWKVACAAAKKMQKKKILWRAS